MRDGAGTESGLSSPKRAGQDFCTAGAALGAALIFTLLLPGCTSMMSGSPGMTADQGGEDPFHRPAAPVEQTTQAAKTDDEACPTPASTPSQIQDSDTAERLVWDRLRSGFALQIPDDPRVDREMQWYASRPDFLERVQERARPYMHFILNEVDKRNLPTELALLPVVESAFQPFAYSSGRAAGIWQFIPSTGREFGLKQTWWYDGRRDVVAATRAALDYLSQLNTQFGGDWALTLAAYNAGAGNVTRAIEKNQRQGRPTDFWSLDLPRETESYVPKLFGVAKLFQDPEAAGLDLKPIPDKPYFTEVDVGGQIDLGLAAQMAGLPLDKLHLLNPGCNRWATDPEGPYELLIPVEQQEQFERALADLDPDQRVRWDRYRIRSGDSLLRIAQRYQTTVDVLREMNGLKGNKLRAGTQLLIPVASPADLADAAGQEESGPATPTGAHGAERTTHAVQSGDTLWDIAQAYGVSVGELTRWNAVSAKDTLRPGQKLVVATQETAEAEVAMVAQGTSNQGRSSLRYSVRRGDSLYKISRRFKVSIEELQRWNKLDGTALQPGQKLKVFLEVTEQTAF